MSSRQLDLRQWTNCRQVVSLCTVFEQLHIIVRYRHVIEFSFKTQHWIITSRDAWKSTTNSTCVYARNNVMIMRWTAQRRQDTWRKKKHQHQLTTATGHWSTMEMCNNSKQLKRIYLILTLVTMEQKKWRKESHKEDTTERTTSIELNDRTKWIYSM